MLNLRYLFLLFGLLLTCTAIKAEESYVPGVPLKTSYKDFGEQFIFNYCIDCHDDVDTSGDLTQVKVIS